MAQNTSTLDTVASALQTVEIAAARWAITDVKAPMAVAFLDKNRLQTGSQQLSLHEVLAMVPGVFALNPDNFAQDLRISIRGFGARAAFGIRGIRVFTDGLPEGTPDGQVDVDNLDLGAIRHLEVLRGAASGLYGNASGGVIHLLTENPSARKPLLEIQAGAGSFGFQRYQTKIGQRFHRWSYFLNVSHNRSSGYRAQSAMRNTIVNGKCTWYLKPESKLLLLANYGYSPRGDDPGGLTQAQMDEMPRQAGAPNLAFATGERVAQGRVGAVLEHRFAARHLLTARAFYTTRRLENRLAIVANGYGILDREYYGGGLAYQWDAAKGNWGYRLKAGLDWDGQSDVRKRFAYSRVGEAWIKDTLALNQQERFQSLGAYVLQEIRPASRWLLTLGLRHDRLNLAADDRYLRNGDQSGEQHYTRFNPIVGVSFSFAPSASAYLNYGSSFETPTLNELGNNPAGTGGFNPDLRPQQARSFEVGAKGL